jgi:molecular chaperone DnaK
MSEVKRKIAGIDLGTTYSAIAHFDEYGKADIIPNSDNERITPSVILFEDGEVIVGKIAKNQAVSHPENVVQFVKRNMGEPDWVRVIDGREYTPEILSAIVLKRVVTDAEEAINEHITDVVITVPAYFNDSERKATLDAGKIAGLQVLGLVNEPTAAALAFGMNHLDSQAKALVYDLGGGTFDVTIIEIDGNNIQVLATDGERRLGGRDWDDMLLNYVAESFMAEHGIDPRDDLEAYQDLVTKCEDTKKALSRKPKANVFVQCMGKSAKISITRELFDELTRPLLEQTETYLDVVLQKASLHWKDIDIVLAVGGSTRMPQVQEILQRVTGREPEKGVNPDECVATGAVYWAAIMLVRDADDSKSKVDQAQHQNVAEEIVQQFTQAAQEAGKIAGQAVPDSLAGLLGGVVVSNVNSHSLGIVTMLPDGSRRNLVMIPEQTPLPCETTKVFGTAQANQVTVDIKIVEGEEEDPEHCAEIGTCKIRDLPANRPAGAKVSVTYTYTGDGLIDILAKDLETGIDARVKIERESNLSDDEVDQQRDQLSQIMGS